ncbi:MAG: NAD(P)H-hydrate dehydratase [Gammaproteobacteria bacterium]|nr:NAD(P)H-hydrate dehydratase [Gammaproteobacteria bacterium]
MAITRLGVPGIELMERAGRASFELARRQWPAARRLAIVCGTGNNGGDGYVIARLAHGAGLKVTMIQCGPVATTGDARLAYQRMCDVGVPISAEFSALGQADLCVDALFGIGLNKPVLGDAAAAVAAINTAKVPVLSIDIPSGLLADTGAVAGCAVQATATVTFIGLKQGLVTGAARDHVGQLFFDALEIPTALFDEVSPSATCATWEMLRPSLAPRPRTAHKGSAGHVLIIGGAHGMSGAARLAAEAALRVGAGLVSVAAHPEVAASINQGRPEIMAHGIATAGALGPLLARASVVAIGPGLGQSPWAVELFSKFRAHPGPLIVDADALNLLASDPESRERWVLTPHPGEAARLLGCDTADIGQDRFRAARALHSRYGGVVVLKGAGTLVQQGPSRTAVILGGNPGMASGGMGDVLTGVIAGFIAQGLPSSEAAVAGAALHAMAGDLAAAAGERGLLASDLMPHLRELVNPRHSH